MINSPNQNLERKRLNKENIFKDFILDETYLSIGKEKKYYLYTYGCQGNESDSDKIRGMLESISFTECKDLEEADLIIMNTCAIRKNAEDKVFGELGRLKQLKRTKPYIVTAICGCMPQEESVVQKILKKYQNVDIVFGTHNLDALPKLLFEFYQSHDRVVDVLSCEGDITENIPLVRQNKVKAWVPIMYGCDEFCSYCIVPYTRGKERSRLPENIINEVTALVEEGYKEVTLLGQNVNAYGQDLVKMDYDFADLLNDLSKLNIARIRFTTSNPKDLSNRQIEAIAKNKNIMPHIHLPVQSGSNKILKKMNRKYTREKYLEEVNKIYELIPDVSLTTDIIVGFPYETEKDFQETLSLIEECKFEGAFSFIFSKREGTPAFSYEDESITNELAHDRLYRLNEIVNAGYKRGNERFLNKTVKVLIEGFSKKDNDILMGYSEHNKLVNLKADKKYIGQIVKCKITSAKTWSLDGEIVEE